MARAPAHRDIEAPPEADRLDDYPHPRFTARLFGHDDAERLFAAAFKADRVPHGWLIGGPQGIGKATLAYRIARHALADPAERDPAGASLDVPADCIAARQVAALSHPDLMLIRRPYDFKAKRFATRIPVDEVRRLRAFLGHKGDGAAWRVVIVDSADEMNINAANALLKSLEEPPPRAIFLLISSQPGRLLATIRSRCRRIDLAPLASDPLRRAVLQALEAANGTHEDADLGRLEHLAGGSVRALLMLSAGDGAKLFERILALVSGLPKVDWPAVHLLADEISSVAAAQRFEAFFDLLSGLISRLARAAATGNGRPEDLALARRLMSPGQRNDALASWAALWETVQRQKADTVALNLDRKALILDTVAQMARLSKG